MVAISKWTLPVFSLMLLCAASSAQPASAPAQQGPTSPAVAAEDILAQIGSGEPLNYDNVTITGQLDLTHLAGPVRQSVKITNSLFQGPLNFNAVSFDGALDLRGCVFQENASFAKSNFLSDVSLSGARFRGQADFQNSHFGGQATFMSTLFLNDTSFGNAQFEGDAVFLNSGFARDVDYNFAQFFR
ncbi:MAG TPA: pentapeptide repeat-containing protein, partial [Methanothrix sp.]